MMEILNNLAKGIGYAFLLAALYVAACPCCGMAGPEAPYATVAVRRWNVLCSKMCRNCKYHLLMVVKDLRRQLHELESGNDDVELGRVDDA